jgi:hypothetical protein
MLRQARIAELDAELAKLKEESHDHSLTNIKKMYYYTYGERHYDVTGWNTHVLDGTIYRSTGRGDSRPDEYFTLILDTTNVIIRFMYSLTQCHEEQCYSVGVLTDKTLYSSKKVQEKKAPGWHNIKRVKDIPDVCNDFERDIIITLAHIAPEPLFFYGSYKNIELPEPGATKFKAYSKLPKKTLNNLKADAAPIYPGEESTDEDVKMSNLGSLI